MDIYYIYISQKRLVMMMMMMMMMMMISPLICLKVFAANRAKGLAKTSKLLGLSSHHKCKVDPLLVINGVITLITGLIDWYLEL